jgi:endoglucanase
MRFIAMMAATLSLATACLAAPLPLKHGVGLHGWLNWSPLEKDGHYRRPPYRTVDEWLSSERPLSDWPAGNEFSRIRKIGFDFVRLSVDPGPLLDGGPRDRKEALNTLSKAVRRVTEAGLHVVFDLHSVSQVPAYSVEIFDGASDSEGVRRYRDMVKAVAGMLVGIGSDKVALEPFNEPAHYPCDKDGTGDWQRIMADTIADIRAVSADLTIVATGACGGQVNGLVDLDPSFDDPNILYSFHMYEPHSFTHQRGETSDEFSSGLPWPARNGSPESVRRHLAGAMQAAGLNPLEQRVEMAKADKRIADYFQKGWDEAMLQARIGEAVDWAKRYGIPPSRLFMGEFGVIRMTADGRSGAFDADRLRYLRAARETAEEYAMPWAVWEYSNPYGMTVIAPRGDAVPDTRLLEALGLRRH